MSSFSPKYETTVEDLTKKIDEGTVDNLEIIKEKFMVKYHKIVAPMNHGMLNRCAPFLKPRLH